MEKILLVNAITFFAAAIKSLSGFGFALLSVPFLILIFSPKIVVPMVIAVSVVLDSILFVESYRSMETRRVLYLLLGGIAGLPFGAYILAGLSTRALKVFIGIVTIVLASLLFLKLGRRLARERLANIIVGFISGGLGGSAAMAGPPVVLLGLNQEWGKRSFRANLIGYFTLFFLASLIIFSRFNLLTISTVRLALIALPGLFLGIVTGVWLKDKVSERAFRSLAFVLVFIGGVLALVLR